LLAVTRWHTLKLKCTTFDFGGAPPQTQLEKLTSYSAPRSSIAGFQGPTSKGRDKKGKLGKRKERKRGEAGEVRGGGACPIPKIDPAPPAEKEEDFARREFRTHTEPATPPPPWVVFE